MVIILNLKPCWNKANRNGLYSHLLFPMLPNLDKPNWKFKMPTFCQKHIPQKNHCNYTVRSSSLRLFVELSVPKLCIDLKKAFSVIPLVLLLLSVSKLFLPECCDSCSKIPISPFSFVLNTSCRPYFLFIYINIKVKHACRHATYWCEKFVLFSFLSSAPQGGISLLSACSMIFTSVRQGITLGYELVYAWNELVISQTSSIPRM